MYPASSRLFRVCMHMDLAYIALLIRPDRVACIHCRYMHTHIYAYFRLDL